MQIRTLRTFVILFYSTISAMRLSILSLALRILVLILGFPVFIRIITSVLSIRLPVSSNLMILRRIYDIAGGSTHSI